MTLITHPDGHVHFSDLKQLAKSPAHYAYRCKNPHTEQTRAMLIGSAVNSIVLGRSPRRPVTVYPGEARRGKEWALFAESHKGHEILTVPEWNEAVPIGDAVNADPVAREILGLEKYGSEVVEKGTVRYEVPLTWTDNGIPCATTGIDIVGPGYLADLKVVHNAEPEYLQKHALRMGWHAQLVWYAGGMPTVAHRTGALHLLCVESSPPHPVTVLTLSPEVIEAGEKCVRAWMERLKVCAESGVYPGYVQSPVTWALPEWMMEGDFDD